MSLALLFSGQGSQHPDMLNWVDGQDEAAATLKHMAEQLGGDWRSKMADAAWASRNDIAQCLITGLALAAWQCLKARLPPPSVAAGYSVGELAAFSAAGVFDAEAALDLARLRADVMGAAVAGRDTGLLAVTGASRHHIDGICEQLGLSVAIELTEDRCVLGGLSEALNLAAEQLTRNGSRCQPLAVRLASHTHWLSAAVPAFSEHLRAMKMVCPQRHLVCNFTGYSVRSEDELRTALAGQIASPVRWQRCMEAVAQRRPSCVLEVGPGSALSRLWNERYPQIPARSADEFRSANGVAHWVTSVMRG